MDHMNFSYGIFNEGNQPITDSKSVYCVGRFNEKVIHIPANHMNFSEDDGNKMAAIKVDSNDFYHFIKSALNK